MRGRLGLQALIGACAVVALAPATLAVRHTDWISQENGIRTWPQSPGVMAVPGVPMTKGSPRALPWARPAIRRLRAHGIRVALVTASTRNVVEHNLARLNLDGVFEAIRYADDVERGKPHPDALLEALDELGVEPGASVYVGDTTVDLEMARAAGVPFEAVGTTTAPDDFRSAGVPRVWTGVGAWADDLLGVPLRRATPRG